MTDEPFGRQGKPVNVTITGGDRIDREEWARRIASYLNHQPCWTYRGSSENEEIIAINPDAVND
jgi:hypothetical protein